MIEMSPSSQVCHLLCSEFEDVCGFVRAVLRVPLPASLFSLATIECSCSRSFCLFMQSSVMVLECEARFLYSCQLVDEEGQLK